MCENVNVVNDDLDCPEFCIMEPRIILDAKKIDSDVKIRNHIDAIKYISNMLRTYPQESTYVVFLDGRLTALGYTCVGSGTPTVCTVSVSKIVQLAVLSGCTGIIMIHNHPDLDEPMPSDLDIECARRLSSILREIDGMILYDSVIVSSNPEKRLYSMRLDKKLDDNPTSTLPLMSRITT